MPQLTPVMNYHQQHARLEPSNSETDAYRASAPRETRDLANLALESIKGNASFAKKDTTSKMASAMPALSAAYNAALRTFATPANQECLKINTTTMVL